MLSLSDLGLASSLTVVGFASGAVEENGGQKVTDNGDEIRYTVHGDNGKRYCNGQQKTTTHRELSRRADAGLHHHFLSAHRRLGRCVGLVPHCHSVQQDVPNRCRFPPAPA